MRKIVNEFLENLREVEDRFGTNIGTLMAIPELPISKFNRFILKIFYTLFHLYLLKIQKNLLHDYYLKELE